MRNYKKLFVNYLFYLRVILFDIRLIKIGSWRNFQNMVD